MSMQITYASDRDELILRLSEAGGETDSEDVASGAVEIAYDEHGKLLRLTVREAYRSYGKVKEVNVPGVRCRVG